MKKYAHYFLLICLLISCSGKNEMPDGIIDPDRMQEVLWDVFLADSWAQHAKLKDTTIELSDEVKALSAEVFRLNGLSKEEFIKNYSWYRDHPEIFNQVLDSLSSRKSGVDFNRRADQWRQRQSE